MFSAVSNALVFDLVACQRINKMPRYILRLIYLVTEER